MTPPLVTIQQTFSPLHEDGNHGIDLFLVLVQFLEKQQAKTIQPWGFAIFQ